MLGLLLGVLWWAELGLRLGYLDWDDNAVSSQGGLRKFSGDIISRTKGSWELGLFYMRLSTVYTVLVKTPVP